jgi:predicted aspartyl protease
MGEIRVRVKLTNAVDTTLVYRKLMPFSAVRSYEATGMIDTGCVSLVLPSYVAEQLGLVRLFKQVAEYADGRKEEVDVTEAVLVEILGRRTSEEAMVLGDEVLIGQTIWEKMDFFVDCREQRLIPNPDHPDQPVMKIK